MKYVLNSQEVADLLGIKKHAVIALYRAGKISTPHIWNGNRLIVMKYPFYRYLRERGADNEKS